MCVAIGAGALQTQNFTTATNANNVAVGVNAGSGVTTGQYNVLMGKDAGSDITSADQNTLIGDQIAAASSTSNNMNGLGHAITCSPGFTTLGVGFDDIRAAHGTATWAAVSDERFKKDIADSTTGLSFINALKPRTFKYKTLGEVPETFNAYTKDSTQVFKNSKTNHGFIAQEVKAAIDADSSTKNGFTFWNEREDGSQEVAEAALIPVLVKAIQEQQTLIESLTARITTLEG